MTQKDDYVEENPGRKCVYTWLCCNFSKKYSYIESYMDRNTVEHLEIICQYNKLCFIKLVGNPVMHCVSNGSQ